VRRSGATLTPTALPARAARNARADRAPRV